MCVVGGGRGLGRGTQDESKAEGKCVYMCSVYIIRMSPPPPEAKFVDILYTCILRSCHLSLTSMHNIHNIVAAQVISRMAVRMALFIEYSPAVQEVPGSIPG